MKEYKSLKLVNELIKKENNKVIIELNLNSIKTLEFLVIHEITHDISSNDIKELIYNYSKKENEFKNISEEVIANICGELLGNKEFIESVLERNLNIFYKELNKKNLKQEYLSFIKNLSILWMKSFYSNRSNLSKTMYHLSKDALNEVDDALYNQKTDINSMVKLRNFTPVQLITAQVNDLPMLVRKGHLRENILTSSEAENMGYSTKGKHYHGLGIDTYMNAIDSLDNPLAVYQYTDKGKYSKDNFIVLTELKDSDNNNIIVPIEIHKRGQYNNVEIDTNKIKTTYGKNNSNYFDNMIKNGSLVEIYNKKRSAKLPIQSGNLNTSVTNNIPQSGKNVKSSTH